MIKFKTGKQYAIGNVEVPGNDIYAYITKRDNTTVPNNVTVKISYNGNSKEKTLKVREDEYSEIVFWKCSWGFMEIDAADEI